MPLAHQWWQWRYKIVVADDNAKDGFAPRYGFARPIAVAATAIGVTDRRPCTARSICRRSFSADQLDAAAIPPTEYD